MPHRRYEWHERVKGVEREYRATRLGLARLELHARSDPGILKDAEKGSLSLPDAVENVEGTYLIRMFAEFENALRSYWLTFRETRPNAEALVDGIGSRRKILSDPIEDVHAVRDYRNGLVHESEKNVEPIAIGGAGRRLNLFLSRLPEEWG
jgi:hypothetical protein